MLEDGSEIIGYDVISASIDDDTDYFNIEVEFEGSICMRLVEEICTENVHSLKKKECTSGV